MHIYHCKTFGKEGICVTHGFISLSMQNIFFFFYHLGWECFKTGVVKYLFNVHFWPVFMQTLGAGAEIHFKISGCAPRR